MLLPIKWMKKYVKIDEDVRKIADELTLSGSHVEAVDMGNNTVKGIIVGKIEKIEKHENADKLKVCHVDLGSKKEIIVTAAPNVFEGAYVPVSLKGSVLADGTVIDDHDFRGVISHGMFCSYAELGFPDKVIPKKYKDGVLILNGEYELGSDIKEVLDMDDQTIEFEITPNRPDCLSIIGMAREAAATFDKDLIIPDISYEAEIEKYPITCELKSDNVSKATFRVLESVEIKESPNYLQNYLMKVGIRPVNNIVDITNYIMMELGQPLHAYDLDKLEGHNIIIDQAKAGEVIKCIDGEERKLDSEDIVIRDGKSIISLAGVMGGFDSEIDENTNRVLIESCAFSKATIRKTSKRLDLRTEASIKFEKGVSGAYVEAAADMAVKMAIELTNAKASKDRELFLLEKEEDNIVEVRYDRVNSLLGTDIDKADMLNYLKRLGFECEDLGQSARVKIAKFRTDISIEADLVEEIGRIYGFHNIKAKVLRGELKRHEVSTQRKLEKKIMDNLYSLGYCEALTYSFISPSAMEKSEINNNREEIKLMNPLGEEYSVMRTSQLPNMLDILAKNQKNKIDNFKIYELGNIFYYDEKGEPVQARQLTLGAFGETDFYKLKSEIKLLLNELGIKGLYFEALENFGLYHPGRAAIFGNEDSCYGSFGEVSYSVAERYEFNKRAYLAVIDLEKLVKFMKLEKRYKEVSKYPKMTRDLALVVDEAVKAKDIESVIKSTNSDILDQVKLFDIYRGEQVGEGKKSMAYKIVYMSEDRTLTDKEVNKVQEAIMESLEKELNISLRS